MSFASLKLSTILSSMFLKEEWEFRVTKADGSIRQQFQPYRLVAVAIKFGLISPHLPTKRWFSRFLGFWSDSLKAKNLITNAGFAGVASRINGAGSEAAFTYVAVGTGTTAAAAGNTTLETELAASGLSRAAATASRVTTTQTNDTAQLQLTYTVTGSAAVTESGVLNASSGGVLLNRNVFSAVNVANGDSLQITHKIKVS